MMGKICRYVFLFTVIVALFLYSVDLSYASEKENRKKRQLEEMQKDFEWWPTDAKPGPVKDESRGGYWWWPDEPGKARPWGNRGYVYVYKIIFDYKEEELPPPVAQELRPSLLIKKIIKNVKIYFDYDKADLRSDAIAILEDAVGTLKRNPETSILITGNCDMRGNENYNEKLGRKRAESVQKFMFDKGMKEERIKIISRGKLNAVAPVTDLTGMQKDRNAQFMVAEIEEVMIPYGGTKELESAAGVEVIDEGKYLIEEKKTIESQIRVSTRSYTIKEGETLSEIAKEQLGGSHRAKFLYEFNKDIIKDPNNLVKGTVISIPVEQVEQEKIIDVKSGASFDKADNLDTKDISKGVSFKTKEYIVKKNDSLWKIAKRELGSGMRWKEIQELNKEKIKNPDRLIPGIRIVIPAE